MSFKLDSLDSTRARALVVIARMMTIVACDRRTIANIANRSDEKPIARFRTVEQFDQDDDFFSKYIRVAGHALSPLNSLAPELESLARISRENVSLRNVRVVE